MATIKAVLRKQKNKQNQYPIAIRITKNRETSYLYIGQSIEEKYWDQVNQRLRSSHLNYARINQLILTKLKSCNEKLIENEASGTPISIRKIKGTILANKKMYFLGVAEIHLNKLFWGKKSKKYLTDRNTIEEFKGFCLNRDLEFSEIDPNLLQRFDVYLHGEKGLSTTAVANCMSCLKAIYNLAISNNDADRNNYPFGMGK